MPRASGVPDFPVVNDVGGFDEDFFAYREEVDLGFRALLRGYRCRLVPEARVRHRGSATLGTPFHLEIIMLTTRNQVLTILKNYPFSLLVRLGPRILVFQILWMGFAIQKRAFLASCSGRVLIRACRKGRDARGTEKIKP